MHLQPTTPSKARLGSLQIVGQAKPPAIPRAGAHLNTTSAPPIQAELPA
ncbi:hypothetical protein ACIBQ1_17290 [Nonomuraea sp. NPDC050153]